MFEANVAVVVKIPCQTQACMPVAEVACSNLHVDEVAALDIAIIILRKEAWQIDRGDPNDPATGTCLCSRCRSMLAEGINPEDDDADDRYMESDKEPAFVPALVPPGGQVGDPGVFQVDNVFRVVKRNHEDYKIEPWG